MSLEALEWLPPDAFTADAVRPALSDAIASWSARWFIRAHAGFGGIRESPARPALALGLKKSGAATEAEFSGRGKRVLLEAILDMNLSGLVLSPNDHQVLDALAATAVEDLLRSLDAIGKSNRKESLLCFALTVAEEETAILSVPRHFLVPAMKSATGEKRGSRQVPKSRGEALRSLPLVAEGILGSAEISLEDLRCLSVGDVVILDNPTRHLIELRLRESRHRIGRGRLAHAEDRFSIQF